MKRKLCLLLCLVLPLAVGCQRSGEEQQGKPNEPKADGEKNVSTQAGEVKVKMVVHDDFLKALESHKGKVVLVDFWSTNCIPCMDKFPKVVKLYNAHRDEGLVCVSAGIFCEEPDALKFLKKVDSGMPNYLVEDYEKAQEHWDFTGIPAYYVIGRNGEIVKNGRFTDSLMEVVHFEDAENVVLAELRKKN